MTVFNRVSDHPFDKGTNEYSIFRGSERIKNGLMNKMELAEFVIREMQI